MKRQRCYFSLIIILGVYLYVKSSTHERSFKLENYLKISVKIFCTREI
ncbi:hypothetical protein TorRG33x02_003610 [Trema orientale]|uniref:Uncharacterized protein n=1 Tax=Trema orientale TaxID=63057 RepID=A0A2P5G213_TREOI|nr:hypothetical protein TorRG33x02_003610 [Trema orientale]